MSSLNDWMNSHEILDPAFEDKKFQEDFLAVVAQFVADMQFIRFPRMGSVCAGVPPQITENGDAPLDAETYLRKTGKWGKPDENSALEKGVEILAQLAASHLDLTSSLADVFPDQTDSHCVSTTPRPPPFTIYILYVEFLARRQESGTIEIKCPMDWDRGVAEAQRGQFRSRIPILKSLRAPSVPSFVALGQFPSTILNTAWFFQKKWSALYGWPGHDMDNWSAAADRQKGRLRLQIMYSKLLARAIVFNRKKQQQNATQDPGGRALESPSDLDESEYQEECKAIRKAHLHYFVWRLLHYNRPRYLLCHRIIRDFVLSRPGEAPVKADGPSKEGIKEWDKKVNSVLIALGSNTMTPENRAKLETTIKWLMSGGEDQQGQHNLEQGNFHPTLSTGALSVESPLREDLGDGKSLKRKHEVEETYAGGPSTKRRVKDT